MKRVFLVVVAIVCGLAVQVVGAMLDKMVFISIVPDNSCGVIGLVTTVLGFVVMGLLIHRWTRG